MKRLTERIGDYIKVIGCKTIFGNEERKRSLMANTIVRLAAYEDSDLTPDEVKALVETRTHENQPLTLDELREMDGEPVWCVDGAGNECWCLVNCDDGLPCCYDNETGIWGGSFYKMLGCGKNGLHKQGWFAYRRKPEERK